MAHKQTKSLEVFKKGENLKILANFNARELLCNLAVYLGLALVVSKLFYNTFAAALIFLAGFPLYMSYRIKIKERQRKTAIGKAFVEMLNYLTSNLRASYSLENAFIETKKNMDFIYNDSDDIMIALADIINGLKVNIAIEKLLWDFEKRCKHPDITSFVQVFTYSKRMGGDMIAIILNTTDILRQRFELERDIESLIAGKKYEFKIMCLIPFAILVYMRLSFSSLMNVLYGNILGIIVMSLALGIIIAAMYIGFKITDIEV